MNNLWPSWFETRQVTGFLCFQIPACARAWAHVLLVTGGGFAPLTSKVQNTQPQLSQLIHPKPHPNGATNLHPLG